MDYNFIFYKRINIEGGLSAFYFIECSNFIKLMLSRSDLKSNLGEEKFNYLRNLLAHAQAVECFLDKNASQDEVDEFYIKKCQELASEVAYFDEIPIASLVVKGRQIIGAGINLTRTLIDPSAHAEIIALQEASRTILNYRLLDCDIYVNLEPCPMCAGAILQARCKRIIFGAKDLKTGACGSRFNLFQDYPMNHQPKIISGVCEEIVSEELSNYFRQLRASK